MKASNKKLKPKEIKEGNLLIAKFMNERLDPSKIISDKTKGKELWVNLVNKQLDSKIPPYNLSWDWLMPVVEKIEKIKLPRPSIINVSVEIKRDSCRIFNGEWNDNKEGFISYVSYEGNPIQYSKITATYLAVVDFIKLYKTYKNGK